MYGAEQFGPAKMALSIEQAATQAGYDVIFSHIANTHQALQTAIQNLSGWRVDGILMIAPVAGMTYHEIRDLAPQTPIVQIDGLRDPSIPSVVSDDAAGTQFVIDHLRELGHSHFVEFSGPQSWFSAQVRHRAMQDVEVVASIECDWTAASAYQATCRLPKNGYTAIVAANDQMALGVLLALQERGIRVPQDVSVVGFDDIPEAPYYLPPLTTVRQEFNEMGVVGIEYLLQLVEDPETLIQQHRIMPKLIVRQSSSGV